VEFVGNQKNKFAVLSFASLLFIINKDRIGKLAPASLHNPQDASLLGVVVYTERTTMNPIKSTAILFNSLSDRNRSHVAKDNDYFSIYSKFRGCFRHRVWWFIRHGAALGWDYLTVVAVYAPYSHPITRFEFTPGVFYAVYGNCGLKPSQETS
jgi:hypothetical protein